MPDISQEVTFSRRAYHIQGGYFKMTGSANVMANDDIPTNPPASDRLMLRRPRIPSPPSASASL